MVREPGQIPLNLAKSKQIQLIVKLFKARTLFLLPMSSPIFYFCLSYFPFAFSFLRNFTFFHILCLCVPVNMHLNFLWTSSARAPWIWNPFVPRETIWLSQPFPSALGQLWPGGSLYNGSPFTQRNLRSHSREHKEV